jgi:sugar phosphate isomerase/epimerase
MDTTDRRAFLGGSLMAVAAGALHVARAAAPPSVNKLSLSTRIVETRNSQPSPVKYEDFLAIARGAGYDALCMRASQGGIQTPLEQLYEMSRLTRAAGLKVSAVSPDFAVPANTPQAPLCLHNITPYLDVAQIFGCDMIRVGMKKDEDIVWAQRASDEARERKLRLIHHAEWQTMFATFEESMRTLKAVNRPNFGFLHDECQWMVNTPDYRPEQMGEKMKRISPWMWNVYVKNQPSGPGNPNRAEISLFQSGGVNFDLMFEGLNAIHYRGYITLHSVAAPMGTPQEAAVKAHDFLKSHLANANHRNASETSA